MWPLECTRAVQYGVLVCSQHWTMVPVGLVLELLCLRFCVLCVYGNTFVCVCDVWLSYM